MVWFCALVLTSPRPGPIPIDRPLTYSRYAPSSFSLSPDVAAVTAIDALENEPPEGTCTS
eukprot:CAMPEP_0182942302 /NCGR_PEP_ID=MMETSP0105_2-20130417/50415_1 /TAXON_ID=81532 ORGANISM="Acanthoeca-like sp., Strain 10tr" /NCGR_SAMPLE_ID=MMETSP0105_2 /ASSEMBLY_ACC=CAM_ASM_000205 /LENGTH=59 /DNA_ID=CAMNT_0025082009 /DNA_START=8 /DNA_END=183 /DNA_ORIENTATION=+